MMWWAIWCAAVVAGAAAAPAGDALAPLALDLPQIDSLTPDDESLSYAGPVGRYAASAPLVYLLPDVPRDAQVTSVRVRRDFTVNPAVELLTDAYSDKARRQHITRANRELLKCIGKRDPWSGPEDCFQKTFGK
ncbi:diuretic hormone 41 isoform X3 [Cydia pomonella]|uniref:Diuretic hormone 34 n=1 Tax=Cydia pomonella TaxID=82600 RepID=A0A514YLK4_CYDPO|nr:diuretic hormone 41 isoform X3 [Cydia pomonella]QDK59891.1 diuretic hormone 34 [Cydia pomonella]